MVRRRRVDQVKAGKGENDRCRWKMKREKEKERMGKRRWLVKPF